MRVAVVGHIEWVEFARVPRVPLAGEITHASDGWEVPAGGGAVSAVQLARLAGESLLITAVGDDERGRASVARLEELGVRVAATVRADEPTRRAFTFTDDDGERTITVIGDKLRPRRDEALPWDELASMDAVFFIAGDPDAVRAARAARVLTATPRELPTLAAAGVALDALVGSARDEGERYQDGDLTPPPRLIVRTAGAQGGSWESGDARGTFGAVDPPGSIVDTYGAGDSFAGGLTYGLGAGMPLDEALSLGAACGATSLTGRGPYERQLRLRD
ncbi:MAG: PfkB family carbohydrate kinase [Thermoleophilaceae bacterium]